MGFTYWLEPFLQLKMGMSVAKANFALSLFWILYGLGCLFSSFAVKYIRLNRYILGSMLLAFLSYGLIYWVKQPVMVEVAVALLGLGCATVFSSGISFGTHQVAHASPRIVSLYITCSGVGTLIGESYSSFVESRVGFDGVIAASVIMLLIAFVIFTVVACHNRVKGSYHDTVDVG